MRPSRDARGECKCVKARPEFSYYSRCSSPVVVVVVAVVARTGSLGASPCRSPHPAWLALLLVSADQRRRALLHAVQRAVHTPRPFRFAPCSPRATPGPALQRAIRIENISLPARRATPLSLNGPRLTGGCAATTFGGLSDDRSGVFPRGRCNLDENAHTHASLTRVSERARITEAVENTRGRNRESSRLESDSRLMPLISGRSDLFAGFFSFSALRFFFLAASGAGTATGRFGDEHRREADEMHVYLRRGFSCRIIEMGAR